MNSYVAQDIPVSTTTNTGKRSARRRRQPYAWLGASALTVGVGVALAGAGAAHADDSPAADSARSSKASASSAPASRGPARHAGDSAVVGSATGQHAAAPSTAASPDGGVRSAASFAQRTQSFAAPSVAAITPTVNAAAALASPATTEVTNSRTEPAVSRRAHVLAASSARVGASTAAPVASAPTAPAGWVVGPAKWLNPKDFGPVLGAAVWAINELQYQVGGLTPILNPNRWPSTTVAPGAAGTLGASGPFGNPLTFSITTQPAHGTVTITPQGTWAYTADPGYGTPASTDSFTVTATDSAFHLENLFGLSGHQSTVTVPVTVDNQAAVGGSNSLMTVWNYSAGTLEVAGYLTNQTDGGPGVGTPFGIASNLQWTVPPYNNHIDVLINPVGVYHEGILDVYNTANNPVNVAAVQFGTPTKIYSAEFNGGGVRVLDPRYCQKCGTLNPSPGGYNGDFVYTGANPTALAFNSNSGNLYVTNGGSNTVSVVYVGNSTVIKNIDVGVGPQYVALSPNRTTAWVTNPGSNSVSVIDTGSNAVSNTVNNIGDQPWDVAVGNDNIHVYVTNRNANYVSVIESKPGSTPQVTGQIQVGSSAGLTGVAVNPVNGNIYVANYTDNLVSVIDPNTNTVIATIQNVIKPGNLAIGPDGGALYVSNGGTANTMTTIDTATNAISNVQSTGGVDAQGLAVDPSGHQVYIASSGSNTITEFGAGLAGQSSDGGIAYYTVSAYSNNSGYHESCTAGHGLSCSNPAAGQIYLTDAPGSPVYVYDSAAQLQVLGAYTDDTASNAQFVVDKYADGTPVTGTGYIPAVSIEGFGPLVNGNNPYYDPVYNPYTDETEYVLVYPVDTTTYSVSGTVTVTNQWASTLSFTEKYAYKVKILDEEASVEVAATETETQTHVYTESSAKGQSINFTVYPQRVGFLTFVSAVYRTYGTWIINASGGVTYYLPHMWHDQPLNSNTAIYEQWSCPISSTCANQSYEGKIPDEILNQFPPGYGTDPTYVLNVSASATPTSSTQTTDTTTPPAA